MDKLKEKKHVFRKGESIRIINPLIITRVGYPWDKAHVIENVITKEQKQKVTKLLNEFGVFESTSLVNRHYAAYEKIYNKFINELAYVTLKNGGFGGTDRTIHTTHMPELKDKVFFIINKRVVKTGKYYSSSGGYDAWNGDYDYEPGGLNDMKTHVVLRIDKCNLMIFDGMKSGFEIEECNVELINKETYENEED